MEGVLYDRGREKVRLGHEWTELNGITGLIPMFVYIIRTMNETVPKD